MSKFQLAAIILQTILHSFALASCKQSSPSPTEIENLLNLETSLERSGVNIQRGGTTPIDLFGIEGQILILDEGEIEVYEFPSIGERELISSKVTADGMAVDGATILWETKPAIWESGSLIVVYWGYDGGVFLLMSSLLGDPLTYEAPPEDEPFPPSVVAAIRYLADDLQVDPALIQVLDYTEVEWPDTCLGAPRPEEQCVQMLTSGWRVMMKESGNVYEIRTDRLGEQVRRK
jgi:hypothetical protein